MVEVLPPRLELYITAPNAISFSPCIFRRIRIMGLWGSGPGDGLVPTAVATRVEPNRHFCQGAGTNDAVSCSVGPLLAGLARPFSFRQYGSGRHFEEALWQEPISIAPH